VVALKILNYKNGVTFEKFDEAMNIKL